MVSASKGYFAISEETSPGVAVTTPEMFYPVHSVDFPFENQYIDNYEIRGSRQALTSEAGAIEGTATVSGAVYPGGGFAKILKGLLGGVESFPHPNPENAHNFDGYSMADLPTFTLERADAFASEGGQFAERLAGCKVESLSLEVAHGELVTFTATFQAMKAPEVVTPASRPTVAPWPSMKPCAYQNTTLQVYNQWSEDFTNVSLEITNTLVRQNTLNGTRESSGIEETGITWTVNGSLLLKETTVREYAEGDVVEKFALNLANKHYTQTPDRIGITIMKAKVTSLSTPMEANNVITQEISLRGDYFDPARGIGAITLFNREDGSLY